MFHLLLTLLFFFTHTTTTEIYTLSLHDALPIFATPQRDKERRQFHYSAAPLRWTACNSVSPILLSNYFSCGSTVDRKSTRLNSSHSQISYAVFCLKKKKKTKKKNSYNLS